MEVPQKDLRYAYAQKICAEMEEKMKKRINLIIGAICLLIYMFPATVFAGDTTNLMTNKHYYETYTALGDSITAGFSLPGYLGRFSNPRDCYVAVASKKLGAAENYNLGLPAYDSQDLLEILTDPSNPYYTRFQNNLKDSELISIDIGSNDLTMTMLDIILESLGYNMNNMPSDVRHKLMEPMLDGLNIGTFKEDLEDYLGERISWFEISKIFEKFRTENIDARFGDAYIEFVKNWDDIIKVLREINPEAAIVALGYYNINPDMNFEYDGITYNIGEVSQKYIDKMNHYISEESDVTDEYIYVDTTGVKLNTINGTIIIDPHPSKAGHAEIAKRITDALLNNICAYTGSGGTVSPEGTRTVAYGLAKAYTYTYIFTPEEGYRIQDVSVDGESAGTPDSYTFHTVSEDHTINVLFTKK